MDARQAEYPKPSACRNLFGPVNHEELTRDLEKHCRDMEEASQRKWNFDFQNHKPLEGKYEWQEVEKGSLPEFYYRPPRPPKGACKEETRGGRFLSPKQKSQQNRRKCFRRFPECGRSGADAQEAGPPKTSNVNYSTWVHFLVYPIHHCLMKQGRYK
ncbi:Cyclin-dependent kinase inhibitor 1B [Manis javanica]|nr:Cyclin-dependent kinase inhibitor 1B [Manis javanica]